MAEIWSSEKYRANTRFLSPVRKLKKWEKKSVFPKNEGQFFS